MSAQSFREGVTAVISLAILGISSWMLVVTFNTAGQTNTELNKEQTVAKTEAYNRQKDILLYAVALLGTVTGYYLGRVPAELHAQQAQARADTAQENLADSQEKLVVAHDNLTSAAATAVSATKEHDQLKQDHEKMKNDVRGTLDRVQAGLKSSVQTRSKALPEEEGLQQAQRELEGLQKRLNIDA